MSIQGRSGLGQSPLVGREAELEQARAALEDSVRGHGHMLTVVGDAGMGKTSFLNAVADEALGRGCRVVAARCVEGVDTPPYWPWAQVVRELAKALDDEIPVQATPSLTPLSHIVPEMGKTSGEAFEPADRFKLFESLLTLFGLASSEQPLLLMFDDAHAADESSLLLLQLLTKHHRDMPLLILAAHDESTARENPSRAHVLSEITRSGTRIILSQLQERDVALIYEAITGAPPAEGTLHAIAGASEGNPFFAEETTRLLTQKGDIHRPDHSIGFRVPRAAADILRARLNSLPSEVVELLSVASVIGRSFQLSLLSEVSGIDFDRLLEMLDTAVRGGVIEESGALGDFRFLHVLIRETLYEDLTAGTRMRLHREIAETLDRLTAGEPQARLAERAHHWFKAAQAGDPNKTIDCIVGAAELATDSQAYEEATRLYLRALKVSESTALPPEKRKHVRQAMDELQRRAVTPDEPASSYSEFRLEGDYWTISYQGRTSRLKDTKGLRYMAYLLKNPGAEIHVLDLVRTLSGTAEDPPNTSTDVDLRADLFGDAGSVLDERAKREYKKRIQELREEVEEAEEFNDLERAARAKEEIEYLVDALSSAVGLGGRDRKAASNAERARVSVTKAIKDALKRISSADAKLGDHLMTTVRTGTYCGYTPDPRVPINWTTSDQPEASDHDA
ncbi:MAG: AAA family ATPase [Actinomycetota bacterium]